MYRVCFVSLLAGVLSAGGCGRSKTYQSPNGEKVTVSEDGASVVVQSTKNGNSNIQVAASEKGIALPGDFPKDAPVYPGATILSSVKTDEGSMISLQTADSPEKVEAYYAKELKAQGWTTESTVKLPQGSNFANKKEKRTLNVSINGADKTMIILVAGEER